MESVDNNGPLVAVVGQTASGKSALAMDLARRFGGEIVAADSRTVYKGLDIGTAKPTRADRDLVKHHLIDVVDPSTSFSVAEFKRLTDDAIADIGRRGRLPLLVGGTGLYVDAVLYDFAFRAPASPELRRELEGLSVEELQDRLVGAGIPLPANRQNPRHLIRSIETNGEVASRGQLRLNTLVIGLEIDREQLRTKVTMRVDMMVDEGLVEEVRRASDQYGWDIAALQAPAYKAFRPYLEGEITLDEAKQRFVQYDMQYAKRQKTWFKRNKDIVWISHPEQAVDLVTTFLNK